MSNFREWCVDIIGGEYSTRLGEECVFKDGGYIRFMDGQVQYFKSEEVIVEYHGDRRGTIEVESVIDTIQDYFVLNDGKLVVETNRGVLVLIP